MISYIAVFIFGAIIGSFLNVCIYRIPRGLSLVLPCSKCPSCGDSIRFYDNIPIISYILLKGRCRICNSRIPIRYFVVELLNAVLYVVTLYRFGYHSVWTLLFYFIFLSSLIVITFIDFEFQIIPDKITLPWIPLSLIFGSTILPDPFSRIDLLGFKASIVGIFLGGGLYYAIAILGKAVFKKDAMGGGDIKLMAMVGGVLGWKGVLLTTFIGSFFGSIIGIFLILMKRTRRQSSTKGPENVTLSLSKGDKERDFRVRGREWDTKIPFGPYLAFGAFVSIFMGQEILLWYLYGG